MGHPLPDAPEKHYRLPIRRPVTTAMAFVTLCVFGWKSYQELPINLMPDISYPTLTVRTEYEGAAPEDVEKMVTRPLEEQLSIVSGLVEVSSTSSAGLSEIVMEFTWGTDMNVAQQDVRDRLDLFDPPKEVTEKPVILRYDPTLDPVFRIAITGKDLSGIADPTLRETENRKQLTELREACERFIKGDLESEQGIAQADIKGGRESEVQVLVDSERVKSLGLSLETIVQALAQQNVNLSGGSLREGKAEYLVRTINEWQDVKEIPDSIIGKGIRLSDVATVHMGEKDRESAVRINGREAVELQIFKWGDANTVKVCNLVRDLFGFDREKTMLEKLSAWMDAQSRQAAANPNVPAVLLLNQLQKELEKNLTLRNRLPEYAEFHVVSDQSRFIKAAIDEVQNSAISGSILAVLVLYLFLRQIKATIIMALAIPVSIIATFLPMFMEHLTLNIMSLGGLAMGVGMLVDNSIVVMESIYRCAEEGDDVKDAADRGTSEVYGPVLSSTLTTICVFLPLAFVQGVAGQLFRDHALTVTYSLLASVLVALYLNPMIASRERWKFTSHGNVIWIVGAYQNARNEKHGPLASVAMVPLYAVLMTAEWLLDEAWHDFEPIAAWVRRSWEGAASGIVGVGRLAFAVVCAPVAFAAMALLFSVHCMLRAVIQTAVTFFFFVSIVLGAIFGAIGWVFHFVFWAPLTAFNRGFEIFRHFYAIMLRRALRFSPAVIALSIVLFVHSTSLVSDLGRELIPHMNQGEFNIRMEAPPGTRLDETERRAMAIEKLAMGVPEISSVAVEIGQEKSSGTTSTKRGENVAEFSILLKNPKENVARQDEITENLRNAIARMSSDIVTFSVPSLFSFKTAIELHVRGDQYKVLRDVGSRVVAAIRDIPGVEDPELNMRAGYPEVVIELDRDLLAAKNIAPEQVAKRLRTEVQGDLPTELSRRGEKIDIRVRTDRAQLSSVNDLRKLSVTDGNPPIPLESVAKISVQEGPSEIRRIDQRQVAVITANVTGRDLGAVMTDVLEAARKVEMPRDYTVEPGGQGKELSGAYSSLQFALVLAIFLVYVVMACQFESILHPALVMTTIPMGAIGVIYTLDVMDIPLSILVYIGVICLAGIVVNNAIVLVDYTNLLIDRGMRRADAVVEAGRVRMRPVLMTTLTTVLGLLPMALAVGEGDEIRRPMAITLIAGLSSSTLLTLVLIPMVYYLFGGRDAKPQDQ